jgi:hypothetical protein
MLRLPGNPFVSALFAFHCWKGEVLGFHTHKCTTVAA